MNPARQSYDYQNGRGLDGFMSAAIDEVSWETNLESTLNTLSQAPIGQGSQYGNTAINYDMSQISGSQGGVSTLGGSGGGSAGTGGSGNLQIDPTNDRITLSDGAYHRLLIGRRDDGTFGVDITNPGRDISSQFFAFTSDQITGVQSFPPVAIAAGGVFDYDFAVPHNLGFIPDFAAVASVPNSGSPSLAAWPAIYYINLSAYYSTIDKNGAGIEYLYNIGIDTNKLYIHLNLINENQTVPITTLQMYLIYFISKTRVV